MAETKILNLDEMIADEPISKVTWGGQDHPVTGMTVEMFLKYQKLQAGQKGKPSDEEQFRNNLKLLYLLAPTMEAHNAELMNLRIDKLKLLVEFVTGAAGLGDEAEKVAGGKATDGQAAEDEGAEPGESTRPS